MSLHVCSVLEGCPKLGLYNRVSHTLKVTDMFRRRSAEVLERFVE